MWILQKYGNMLEVRIEMSHFPQQKRKDFAKQGCHILK